jgi:hypothetical protein
MSATQVRSFIFEDPSIIWLEYHGKQHGFEPDKSSYDFIDFIAEKAKQFENKWSQEMAPEAILVCRDGIDIHSSEKVLETYDYLKKGIPVIAQPALWWAPQRIYGIPDFIIHSSWIEEKFPQIALDSITAPLLKDIGLSGYYIIFDLKFTTKLDDSSKVKDLNNYAAQVRIYSYILGQIQGLMPPKAYLITRDRIFEPFPVNITSKFDQPVDEDLAIIRDKFVDIKLNGANYLPWRDEIVASNYKNNDERWMTVKDIIANKMVPGGDPLLLYQIGIVPKNELNKLGFPNLDSLFKKDSQSIPFEKCRGLGSSKSKRIRAILDANKSGNPVAPIPELIPPKKKFEFFIDFEYFTNINVDFNKQWPSLEGCEMIFMIGVGFQMENEWDFQVLIAENENHGKELEMFERYLEFLHNKAEGFLTDPSKTTLYHWTSAEVWQSRRVVERHTLQENQIINQLPWYDLQKVFLNSPCGIPGAWDYSLKHIAKSLGKYNSDYDTPWPGDLDKGLRAMVMGWRAYTKSNPLQSKEMNLLTKYLEADCKALWNILRWIRSY